MSMNKKSTCVSYLLYSKISSIINTNSPLIALVWIRKCEAEFNTYEPNK